MQLIRIRHVEPLEGYVVQLVFSDGTRREIDLDKYLHGPIFQPLRDDPELFRAVRVGGGTLTWPNGADIDPDVLYHQLAPAWAAVAEPSA